VVPLWALLATERGSRTSPGRVRRSGRQRWKDLSPLLLFLSCRRCARPGFPEQASYGKAIRTMGARGRSVEPPVPRSEHDDYSRAPVKTLPSSPQPLFRPKKRLFSAAGLAASVASFVPVNEGLPCFTVYCFLRPHCHANPARPCRSSPPAPRVSQQAAALATR
jgi:hypothetical protein